MEESPRRMTCIMGLVAVLSMGIRGDVIRLVPSCDSVCMKGRLLASYYSSPVVPALVRQSPLRKVAKTKLGASLVNNQPKVIEPMQMSRLVYKQNPIPVAKQVVSVASSTPIPVGRIAPRPDTRRRIQQPVVMHQPEYLMPLISIPQRKPGSLIVLPQQNVNAIPNAHPQVNQSASNLKIINKIRKRVSKIYHMLTGFKKKYLPMQIPSVVFVSPAITNTSTIMYPTPPPRNEVNRNPAPPTGAAFTMTKSIVQSPEIDKKTVVGAQPPSTVCNVSPPKSRACQDDGEITSKPETSSRSPKEESSSSDLERTEPEHKPKRKMDKPPYLLKSVKPRKRNSPDRPARRLDIGNAVIYRGEDVDSNDEVVYLSDLLKNRG